MWCWFSSNWSVIATGELFFLIKTNMNFSSWFFMVNVKLNLQRKRYVQSRRVNLIFLRFMLKISCYKIKTQSLKWTNSPRQNQMGKKEKFCLQITTAQIGLTTQERQNQVKKKGKVLPSDNNSSHTNDKTGKKIKKWRFFPHGDKSDYTREWVRNNKRTRVSSGFCFRNCEIVQYD